MPYAAGGLWYARTPRWTRVTRRSRRRGLSPLLPLLLWSCEAACPHDRGARLRKLDRRNTG